MRWNYRLMIHNKDNKYHTNYAVHEVYYYENGDLYAWTEGPVELVGDSEEDLIEYLQDVLDYLVNPHEDALDYDAIVKKIEDK